MDLTIYRTYVLGVIQIVVLAFPLYYLLKFLRRTKGYRILLGICIVLVGGSIAARELALDEIGWLLDHVAAFLPLAMVIIFQPELRRVFAEIGSRAAAKPQKPQADLVAEIKKAVDLLVGLPIGAYGVLALVMLGYLVLGAVMDELAMILLTVPIVYPVMMKLGFDPVWFGVIIVMAVTFGMICPPVGMNVFVINSIARDISLSRIYKGTMPFIAVDVVRLLILCAFPALSLWLPGFIE